MAAITAGVVGSLAAGAIAAEGSRSAGRAQERGANAATAEQARQFDASLALTAPRREVEGQALNQLAQLTGLQGNQAQIDPATGQPMQGGIDYSAFYNSPDYQFALQEGEQATLRNASALGNVRSGNTLAALQARGQGLATQNFGNYINRLQGLAGMGADQSAANMTFQQGQIQGQNIQNAANARASGIAGSNNALASGIGQAVQLGGYFYGQRQPQNTLMTGVRQPNPYMGGYNA